MSAADFDPLNIDPRTIVLGAYVDPKNWQVFTSQQQRVLRGMMAGRVIRRTTEKVMGDRVVAPWVDLFPTIDEAKHALGEEIFNGVLNLTTDHSNVRMANVRARTDRKGWTGYAVFEKAEDLLKQMPTQFTWADLMVARQGSIPRIARMGRAGIAVTVYLHIIAGNIEHFPNPMDEANPTLTKRHPYLYPKTL